MILLSYDGSLDAQAAVSRAAELMPGAEVTVLTVWQPLTQMMTVGGTSGIGLGLAGMYSNDPAIDEASQRQALATATNGAERATADGLVAQPRAAPQQGTIAAAVLSVADDIDADVIVLGTRGLSGVKSFVLGSVSHAVVQHSGRPVLIVPSSVRADQRHGWGREPEEG